MKMVSISTNLLTRLIDGLEARIPEPTGLCAKGPQREVDARIERDRALVDEARHLLRPSFKGAVDEFATWTLEEMRMAREVALKNGNQWRAFALATAIDIRKGHYK